MSQLLRALFSSLRPNEQLCVKRRDEDGVWHQNLLDSVDDLLQYAASHPQDDLYFGVSPRERGDIDAVSRVVSLWADLDLKDFHQDLNSLQAVLDAYPAEPSAVVDSGHGRHIYWFLSEDALGDEAQEVMRRICERIGADPAHHPGWVLRVPGTTNYKDREHPAPVQELFVHEGLAYPLRDLAKLTGVSPRVSYLVATGNLKAPGERKKFRSRSERDFEVLRELTALGVSRETIKSIFVYRPVGDKYREAGTNQDHYLEHSLDNASNAFEQPDGPFLESNDMYLYRSGQGRRQISTFVFEPQRLLVADEGSDEGDAFLGTIRAAGKTWPNVILPKSAFSTAQQFLRFLNSMYWQWLGQDAETRQLCLYLMRKLADNGMSTAKRTSVVGRHGSFWVTPEIVFDAKGVYPPEAAPIVYVNRGGRSGRMDTAPRQEFTWLEEREFGSLVRSTTALLPGTNTNHAVAMFTGWFMASPLKPLLETIGERFPHLNVYGTKGSGKTHSIQRIYFRLLGVPKASPWTPNTTTFILRTLFSSTNAVPVWFNEFRAATINSANNDFIRTVLMSYDVGRDSRGRADLTTETFDLLAPLVIDGEDALFDGAARERTVYINLHPEVIATGTIPNETFGQLVRFPLDAFAGRYLQHTLSISADELRERYDRALAAVNKAIPLRLVDRMRRNLAVVVLGLDVFNEFVEQWGGVPISWDTRTFAPMWEDQQMLLTDGSTRSSVDDFIEDVVSMVASSQMLNVPFLHFYDKQADILWIHLNTAVRWWQKDMRQRGLLALEVPAMRSQMLERSHNGPVIPERVIQTPVGEFPCFGLHLPRCVAAGLSVPSSLDATVFAMRGTLLGANESIKLVH